MTVATFMEWPKTLVRDIVADAGRNVVRYLLLAVGIVLVVLGVLMAPIPGPLGVPVTLAGLILVLRNSYRLRRTFVRFQHKHPRIAFPVRRLLRRDPAVAAVAYQQALRIERAVLPKSWRVSKGLRHKYFRKAAAK